VAILRQEGFSDANVLLLQNTKTFQRLRCFRTDKEELWQCRYLRTRGRVSIFRDFVRTSFMNGLQALFKFTFSNAKSAKLKYFNFVSQLWFMLFKCYMFDVVK